jgi:histidyl-tRNA synthetase
VDIVGETSEVADAELMGVAIDVMRELGLTDADVRVRVSDRRLLFAGLDALGFDDSQRTASLGVIDKLGRQPREVSVEKLTASGIAAAKVERLLTMVAARDLDGFVAAAGGGASVKAATQPLHTAMAGLDAFGLRSWIDFDPTIVRGLAYYTGIVFELFDARGEFRAICGGGRYDDLLKSLGGVDLPALGFGMGDVVLSELLRSRGLMPANAGATAADVYVVGGSGSAGRSYGDALGLVRALREAGFTVDYALSEERYASQAPRNQLETAKKSGARAAIYFDDDDTVMALWLGGRLSDAPRYSVSAPSALRGEGLDNLRDWLQKLNELPNDG